MAMDEGSRIAMWVAIFVAVFAGGKHQWNCRKKGKKEGNNADIAGN